MKVRKETREDTKTIKSSHLKKIHFFFSVTSQNVDSFNYQIVFLCGHNLDAGDYAFHLRCLLCRWILIMNHLLTSWELQKYSWIGNFVFILSQGHITSTTETVTAATGGRESTAGTSSGTWCVCFWSFSSDTKVLLSMRHFLFQSLCLHELEWMAMPNSSKIVVTVSSCIIVCHNFNADGISILSKV